MNADFPRILTLLRKEKGISQKQAATELKVSQALLSHYEKGIRECGLEFVLRAADFYNVSCDYLLGRSPERSGLTITMDEIVDNESNQAPSNNRSLSAVFHKKVLIGSINILYDLLMKSGSKVLINEISMFLTLSIYRMFRIVFRAHKKNNEEMFTVPKELANAKAAAQMCVYEAELAAIVGDAPIRELEPICGREHMALNLEVIETKYANDRHALLSLIKTSEDKLK